MTAVGKHAPPPRKERRALIGPALLLFVSGAAGLIYQLLWVKQLSLIVGIDVYAITIAVSAFFAGLALGSAVLGRWADRAGQPLRFYAALESGVALLAVLATLILSQAAPQFAWLDAHAGMLAWLLPFTLVGIPAVLMGGTVPVLVRALRPEAGQVGHAGGALYAANTCGAIAGTVLCVFTLIPAFGVLGAALVAACLNLAAAFGALFLVRGWRGEPGAPTALVELRASKARVAIGLYAVAGALALGYEVIWSQAIVQWTSTRTFAFAIVLATYLAGIALGSALAAPRAGRIRDPWGSFALLIAAAGAVALLEVAALGEWLQPLQVKAATLAFNLTASEAMARAARFLVAALCVVLVPTVLLGAAFPIALQLIADASRPGRDTGLLLGLNTTGGIAGTLLTGLILVPALGVERALGALAVGAGIVGVIAVLSGTGVARARRWATLAIGAAAVVAAILISPDHLAQQLAKARGGRLLFHEPSAGGTVAVIEQGAGANRFRRLYVQGVSNSGDSLTSLRYMRLQGLLPLIIHKGEPRSALVIGLGTGITAGSLLTYPGLDARACVELLAPVTRAARLFHGNYAVAQNTQVEIRVRDGRRELLQEARYYDLITLEPPPPSAAGVVNLYSRDFYALAAQRLRPDGLFAQWLPLPTQTAAATRSLVRSFLDAFPYATLWTTEFHETLLLGSLTPIELDAVRITERFNQPAVSASLREVGIATPAALLATWLTDRAGLERYARDARPVTDDRPIIEYSAWVLPDEFARMLPELFAVQTHPPLRNADDKLRDAVQVEHERLLRFYEAGLFAYIGDRASWSRTLESVLAEDGGNPYYRWIAGSQ